MGFADKWAAWIRWCISTTSFSVLVNGTPSGFFHSSRGWRQGDPLSPYLFVIGMEALCTLINKAVSGGFLSGCRIRGRVGDEVQITHLLFANDTLVFCEATTEQMSSLCWILMWFKAISGLKINLDKRKIFPVGRADNVEELALELGYKVGALPSYYLGLPLGTAYNLVVVWDGVEERFRRRGGLGVRCLSKLNRALLGDGRRVRFWEDRWCRDKALSLSFPSLYALVTSKEAWVAEVWDATGEDGGSNPRFSRPFNDWEMEMVERFIFLLQGRGALEGSSTVPFPKSIIWSTCVPTKVVFFAWEATWETIDHLQIHCTKAMVLWELLFNLFGVMWVLPSSVKEILLGWYGVFVGKKRVKVWGAAPLCLFWTVWKERNRLLLKMRIFRPKGRIRRFRGDFLIDGLSPGKWPKCERYYALLTLRCILGGRTEAPQGIETCWFGLGRSENPDVVMIQETKRRFVIEGLWVVSGRPEIRIGLLFRRLGHQIGGVGFKETDGKGHKFMRRLQYVKAKLKEWNKFSFGELKEKKKSILNDLANFDAIEQEGGLNPDLRVLGVEGLDWSPISEESALRLDSPFTEEEISKAIFQLDRDKAPGPDGFTIAVFQECWDVIKEDLKEGFSPRWRKWMSGCLSSVSYAILVNGSAKGLLSRMLMRAEERNMMEGFREEELQTLKSLLLVFGHISGLKVNLNKSSIYGINLDQAHLSRLAEMLDCKASGWPILYLGLPLGGNPKACGFWDPVVERISSRLDGWQKAYLSFGGRITLIQSCLTHLPRVGEGKRDHLVRWDVVCKPKTIGGLGLGNISWRNLALLGKWLWRYPREGSALWHQVILSIYGSHSNGWDANTLEDGHIAVLGRLLLKSFRVFFDYSNFPSKFVWNSQVPFKVKSFVWLVAHKKVNTNDMLQVRRPYKALSPDICILCMKHGESADHLFLHCSLTIGLWHRLFQLAKMDWVPPRSIYDMMFIKFKGFGNSKRGIVCGKLQA
ncbi:putative mitochondrial protein [Vitis vinifera]|uniref:Putative mitochondrial protein n=1 Tax=Vitis vinifera TaxID=29760 RepID=A0A438CX84_VITVI|nr:putative mitochondrial protein [Vitis vinifera]